MKKFMARVFAFKRMYLLLLLPISLLLVLFARLDSRWVESFYVPYIYKPMSRVIGSLSSLVPFSITEWLSVMLGILLIYYLVRVVVQIYKNPKAYKHTLYKLGINALCLASCAVFLFQICMGLNYYRATAESYLGLEVQDSSVEELYILTLSLALDMNSYRETLKEDANGVAVLDDANRYETSLSAKQAYSLLSQKYTFLKAVDIRNKPLISSKLFSAFLTTGIYIPYTFESNINIDVPQFSVPATMCHELTHFRGFMRENEANFLGYLACLESTRLDFRYSGVLMAFSYCYPKLSKADNELARQVAGTLSDAVIRDITFEDSYWEPYRKTVTAKVSDKIYNGYLNVNDQQSGTQSYGEMVDLLLAYQRQNNG